SSKAVKNSEEFRALASLGPKVLPLIVDKLLQPDEFFALQLYDTIEQRRDLREEDRNLGEQKRALATARRWLSRVGARGSGQNSYQVRRRRISFASASDKWSRWSGRPRSASP